MAEIVEVRFIKDTQNVHTGNEFYPSGATAHFFDYQTDVLVEQGWAVLASEPPTGDPPFPPALAFTPPVYDKAYQEELDRQDEEDVDLQNSFLLAYEYYTMKELKMEAGIRGVHITSRMRKADLIAALED